MSLPKYISVGGTTYFTFFKHLHDLLRIILKGYLGDGQGKRDLLFHEWASFKKILKFQPLDAIRDYFGVKVALYFAWLGFYTNLLIVPSIVGVICFIYGLLNLSTHIPSQEICSSGSEGDTDNHTKMCPACDHWIEGCDYWNLSNACTDSKILSLFDNESTIFFAIFMSIWGKSQNLFKRLDY